LEVEKLSQTIHELEEIILSSGVNANAIRDYQRQISELQVGISYGHCHYELNFGYIGFLHFGWSKQ